mmetsp:Transcript_51346/g.100815  ORF Transcript_51346/g.100815 Transcript_51346/m.100815 type:complete len:131 (+) Transcript_51346:166-558(+)
MALQSFPKKRSAAAALNLNPKHGRSADEKYADFLKHLKRNGHVCKRREVGVKKTGEGDDEISTPVFDDSILNCIPCNLGILLKSKWCVLNFIEHEGTEGHLMKARALGIGRWIHPVGGLFSMSNWKLEKG